VNFSCSQCVRRKAARMPSDGTIGGLVGKLGVLRGSPRKALGNTMVPLATEYIFVSAASRRNAPSQKGIIVNIAGGARSQCSLH